MRRVKIERKKFLRERERELIRVNKILRERERERVEITWLV